MTDDPYKAPEHQAERKPWTWRPKSNLVACLILAGATVVTWRITGSFAYGVLMWAVFGVSVLAGKLFGTPAKRD